jgi:hypothetical protein
MYSVGSVKKIVLDQATQTLQGKFFDVRRKPVLVAEIKNKHERIVGGNEDPWKDDDVIEDKNR